MTFLPTRPAPALLAAILAGLLASCSDAPPVPALARRTAGVASIPADSAFYPYNCSNGASGDSLGDPVTGGSLRDIVGDATHPAFYRAGDANNVYFRMRVSGDPRKPGGTLAPSSWDVLVDTDGNYNTYEYMLTADGNMSGTKVEWVRNSVQVPGDPKDRANDAAGDLLYDFTPSSDYYLVTSPSDGSNFGGDADYFITLVLPKYALTAAGINLANPFVVWAGTNAQNYSVNADFGCFLGMPTTLADATNDPGNLDPGGTPVANADSVTTPEDAAVTTSVLANDTGLRDTPLAVTITAQPSHGSAQVNAGNTVTYTPAANYFGSDAYTYRVADADGQFSTAVVSVTVTPVNDGPPVAVADSAITGRNQPATVAVLANDGNLVDTPIAVSIASAPAHGSAAVNADKTVTYTPSSNYSGTDAFTYRLTDRDGDTATAQVSVEILSSGAVPSARADSATTAEDAPAAIDVLANDTGLTDTPLVVTVLSGPANGQVQVNGNNTITYTPSANWSGQDGFTYQVTDWDGQSSSAAVSVTVTPADDGPPQAVSDADTVAEDGSVTTAVLANDGNLVDTPIAQAISAAPAHGTALVNPDGTITYTPAADFNGADSYAYRLTDRDGQSGQATVTITVTAVDDGPPVAADDAVTTLEDTAVTTAVLANDANLIDAPVSVQIAVAPAHGSAVVNGSNAVVYTPDGDYHGPDSYAYTVTDADGESSSATVAITVTAVDDGPPVAVNDTAGTIAGSSVTTAVLANDLNLIDEPISVTVFAQPLHGTATASSDGTITYQPGPGYFGPDSYRYQVSDSDGQTSTATVSVSVSPAGSTAPIAQPDFATTDEDAPVTTAVMANDSNLVAGPYRVKVVSAPAHGTAAANADGTITYTPAADYNGPDAYDYGITDRLDESSITTVTLDVAPVDDGPPVANADADGTAEDTPVTTAVLANDSNLVDTPITVTVFNPPSHGAAVVNADGSITYTPAPDFSGADAYDYQVMDEDGQSAVATVTLAISPVSDGAPDASADSASTLEDTSVTVAVLANDTGLEDAPVTVTVAQPPAHGTAFVNADGTIDYHPAADYAGSDQLTYRVTDQDGQWSEAQVSITVTAVSDGPPVARADTVTTLEGTAAQADVLANDDVTDGPAQVSIGTPPAHGAAAVNGDGTVTYSPAAHYNGTDSYEYVVTDADGETATAAVTVTVTPVDDGPPDAQADAETTPEDTPVTTAVLGNDGNLWDAPISVSIAMAPLHGAAVANGDGTITYSPAADYNGPDSYGYSVTDADGETSTAMVTVTVTPVDDGPPDAQADAVSTPEDTPVTTAVLANDGNLSDAPLSVSIAVVPLHGAALVNPDGSITYSPAQDFHGADAYQYTVTDADGQSSTAMAAVTVTPVDDGPPVANADAATVAEDGSVDVPVLENDGNLADAPVTVRVAQAPSHGMATAQADGSITYAPARDFNGSDAFTYVATDSDGQSSTATVSLTVTPVNDVPEAADDSAAGATGPAGFTIPVLGNDHDADGDPLAVTAVTQGAHGAVTINPDGTLHYVPAPGFIGTDEFTYAVSDGHGGTATATVGVWVRTDDSDGDGLGDAEELAAGTDPHDADSDDDGVPDGSEPRWNEDSDGDGLINALDPDSDNDGIFDGTELGVTTAGADTDVSRGNFVPDADPSTTTDPLLKDTDHGGVPDGAEDSNHNGRIDPNEGDPNDPADDLSMLDSDGDGLNDAEELAHGTNPHDADSDDDGVMDGAEPNWTADTDGDGLINALDPDSDGDGIFDGTELGVTAPGPGTDVAAGHFIPDADPTTHTNPLLKDTDHGGVPDGQEDLNHNGAIDPGERDPLDPADDPLAILDGMGASGGGCAAAGNASPAMVLALALGLLLRRTRRP